jgi:hypothetical protein
LSDGNDKNDPSEFIMGGYDQIHYTGPLNWHKIVDNRFYYAIQLNDILLNGKSLGICTPESRRTCTMVPDSGTSLLAAPSWAYEILAEKLPFKENCKDVR